MVIGITGGIGSGQSTVAKMFAKLGAKVIIADKLAREIESPGQPGYKAILKVFGKTYLDSNNQIDRKKLGKLVFGSKKQLRLLNQTVHPILIKRIQQEIKKLNYQYRNKTKKPLIMVEAAILYETKMDRLVDYVIVVYATKSQRFKRIKKRDNLTTLEIKSRMAAQIPLEQKKKKTEFIINNTGGLKQTEQQVKLNYRGFNTLLYLQELVKLLEHMQ